MLLLGKGDYVILEVRNIHHLSSEYAFTLKEDGVYETLSYINSIGLVKEQLLYLLKHPKNYFVIWSVKHLKSGKLYTVMEQGVNEIKLTSYDSIIIE